MIKIAFYGKGGIGKSTTTSNISAALSKKYKVMQIGCDPKSDSTKDLLNHKQIPTVLSQIRTKNNNVNLEDVVFTGYNGILCVEAGGPTPGIGCAGLGIIAAFEKLEQLKAFDVYKPDIVMYDVLGDVVCGGFAMPIRDGYAENIFIVTSGEMMSLFAANNIVSAVNNFSDRGYATCSGLILNSRNVENEVEIVEKASKEMNVPLISKIQRSPYVQLAEKDGKTVIEAFPDSDIAKEYIELSDKIVSIALENEKRKALTPKRKGARI